MIYKTADKAYCFSTNGVWRPGAFESETAVRAASALTDEVLQQLQDAANARGGNRLITEADLEKLEK